MGMGVSSEVFVRKCMREGPCACVCVRLCMSVCMHGPWLMSASVGAGRLA
jgi:hypothetical protein